jgi:NTE family protein
MWENADLRLAEAASAAFPPYLSPAYITVAANKILPVDGADLCRPPFTTRLRLTDGGVYDNMAWSRFWKRYRTVLVSDGGLVTPPAPKPRGNWLSQSMRVTNISLQEGINTCRRVLLGLERIHQRQIVYWGIGQGVGSYKVGNPLNFSQHDTELVAGVPTRLKRYLREIRQRILLQDMLMPTRHREQAA